VPIGKLELIDKVYQTLEGNAGAGHGIEGKDGSQEGRLQMV